MSFEYNGFIHRDLEPQVRYDAEQVQLLKQADVAINESLQTINENLQTVNTEVNGKLTKPTNPSAESAVTMLADGTVGTKPLSEIGGGGKLYLHRIKLHNSGGPSNHYVSFYVYSSTDTHFTIENLYRYFDNNNYATLIDENSKIFIGNVSFTADYFNFRGTIVTGERGSIPSSWESKNLIDMPLSNISISSYTVTEL